MVELGLVVGFEDEEAVVNEPGLVGFGIDIHGVAQAYAGNYAVGVVAVPPDYPLLAWQYSAITPVTFLPSIDKRKYSNLM